MASTCNCSEPFFLHRRQNMPLSDEAIIGIFGLFLTCGPLAVFLYQARYRRRPNRTTTIMRPSTPTPTPTWNSSAPPPVRDIELGIDTNHVMVTVCVLSFFSQIHDMLLTLMTAAEERGCCGVFRTEPLLQSSVIVNYYLHVYKQSLDF